MHNTRTYMFLAAILAVLPLHGFARVGILQVKQQQALDSARYYHALGEEQWGAGNFDASEAFFKKSLAIKLAYFEANSPELATTYNNLGVLSKQFGKYDEALEYYGKAEGIYISNYGDEYRYLAYTYINKGNIYKTNMDFDKALDFYKKSLDILEKDTQNNLKQISIVYNNIGNLYWETGRYAESVIYYNKSLEISVTHNQNFLPYLYNNLALGYRKLNHVNEANLHFTRAINSFISSYGDNYFGLADTYMNYGLFYLGRGDYTEAIGLLEKALQVYVFNYGIKHPKTSGCLANIGDYYLEKKGPSKALVYYQQALISLSENFNDTCMYSNPGIDETFSRVYLLSAFKKKANGLQDYYTATRDVKDLEAALSVYGMAARLVENIRAGYQAEESRLSLSENEAGTYQQAIKTAYRLFQITREKKYRDLAFEYAERSKAASLLASLQDVSAKKTGGIPAALQKEEESLKRELSLYKEMVYEEKRQDTPDPVKISIWENKLFSLGRQYDSLVTALEKGYPKYYRLKYKHEVASPNTLLQNLAPGQTLLEYAFTDSVLYIFTAGNRQFTATAQAIDSSFYRDFETVHSALTNNNFSVHTVDDFRAYIKAAYRLFCLLVKPVEKYIKSGQLTIVPDERLAYLPFDALLTEMPDTAVMDYRDLPYMIKRYTTGYSYSATLLLSEKPGDRYYNNHLLAFAPSYQYNDHIADIAMATRQYYRDKLFPIPGVKKEVEHIVKIIGGDTYIDTEATERNFKKYSSRYDILHLAMHTIIDDENPMFSKLAFAQVSDSTEDGFLNTHEIYNMDLHAKMAVLSSCNSGSGKFRKGEGVMSLARGFIYAGCPGIVMTLWAIEDKSSVDLMGNFYKYLTKGASKSDALRHAKVDFLKNADQLKAHPYFWASYVTIGDNSPIYKSKNTMYMLTILIASILALLIFIFRKIF